MSCTSSTSRRSATVSTSSFSSSSGRVETGDVSTGDEVWKTDRTYKRPRESDQAYTTPTVCEVDGVQTIVTWGADHLTGHDLQSGELLWQCGGFNPAEQGMWRVIASQTVADGMAVFVAIARGRNLSCVRRAAPRRLDLSSAARHARSALALLANSRSSAM